MNCFNMRELQSLLRNRFSDETSPINLITRADKPKSTLNILSFVSNRSVNDRQPQLHGGLSLSKTAPTNTCVEGSTKHVKLGSFMDPLWVEGLTPANKAALYMFVTGLFRACRALL